MNIDPATIHIAAFVGGVVIGHLLIRWIWISAR